MLHKLAFLLALLIELSFNLALAQDPLLKHYTTNDGLPSSTIYRLLQDKQGYIWLATDVGVSRFDGKRFENFTISDGLADNEIMAIGEDSEGRIWFLGFNGSVSYFFNGKIFNSHSDKLLNQITTTTSFIGFFEDNKNRLWFISQSEIIIKENDSVSRLSSNEIPHACIVMNCQGGQLILASLAPFFHKFDNGKLSLVPYKYNFKNGCGYYKFRNGNILFPAKEGIVLQTPESQKIILPFDKEFATSPQFDIELSPDSSLWISTTGGVYCYDYKNLKSKPVNYLKNKIPSNLLSDLEGNIWISTLDDGLYMIPSWGRKVRLLQNEKGLSNNQCYAIRKLNNGNIIVGQNKGRTIIFSEKKVSELDIKKDKIKDSRVHHIITRNDDVLIASDSRLIHLNQKDGSKHFIYMKSDDSSFIYLQSIKDITWAKDKIYIARNYSIMECAVNCAYKLNTRYGAGSKYCVAKFILNTNYRIYSIYFDYNGVLWFGTKNGLQSKKGDNFINHSQENTLLTRRINSIAETKDSVLIFATHGYGILLYKNGKLIRQITTKSGLSNDICRRVYVNDNRIYVATPSGISILLIEKENVLSIYNLNTGNFLTFNDINDVYADDKEIFVATMNGLAVIKQEALNKLSPAIPRLFITKILINDSLIDPSLTSAFNYSQNAVNFNFVGIYFQGSNDVNYRYRLKNNQLWQTTKSTSLEFPYLPPGEYNFQLQARVMDGEWSAIKNYKFEIKPPFWNEDWFLVLVFFLITTLIYIFAKIWMKSIRKKHDEKIRIDKQITELEQQALQTMMNPHFIFNVMNSIQHFVNSNDKKAANQYLADFAKLIRMNLNISYKRFIAVEEEIDYLNLYLSFEKLRFGDKLTYEIIVDPNIDLSETTVAVMMIQPFVENAIWHGILTLNTAGHIKITIGKVADDLLKVIVEDNGIGINDSFIGNNLLEKERVSHGLSMTVQRLKLLGKAGSHKLYINYNHIWPAKQNKGTKAEMLLPARFN